MGQKSSSSNRFLQPLPELYEKNDASQVYSLKGYSIQTEIYKQNINPPIISNPQAVTDKLQSVEGQQPVSSTQQQSLSSRSQQSLPPFLKHFIILLNQCETRQYLNHLVYRNQPQFRDFIVQMPFGEIQKQAKYTKVHLYVDQLILTLNQVFNLPFYDMSMVLYTSLVAYKYLYSYFGHFKIEANMIGFTREGKAKVWLNHKLTKDKPLPIVSDINLKRFKEEESYMVDDLLTIFSNKVDRQTIPQNFTLLHNASSIRASRATRLYFSRVSEEQDLSKSTVSSLENNLINDFSDCSFDKCLEYLEGYFSIKRPDFFVVNGKNQAPQQQGSIKTKPYKNFIPSIFELIKTRKQFPQQANDLRNSRLNTNINLREVIGIKPISNQNITGLPFRRSSNQISPNTNTVNRPNIMFNSTAVINTPMVQIRSPSNQQVKFTSSNTNYQVSNSIISPQQDRSSKSKPKVTFNTTNSLYQRIPQTQVNSPSLSNHQFKSSSSIQKRPVIINSPSSMHGSLVTPSKSNDFSFHITTSQVHPVYSSTEIHQNDLKTTFSSQHIQWKSGLRAEENQDRHDRDSIIDGVTKV